MNSSDYWKKREEENLKKNLKTEAEYVKELDKIYDYMMDQIQKEINGFYVKYAKKEGITLTEAKKRVSKLDMEAYERKAAKYVKEKNFSEQANEEMRLYNATMKINRLEMLKANIGLELVDGYDGLQKYYDKILTDRTLDEFKRQAGILGKTIQNNAKAANAIVNASFHNAKFSDRIWMYQDMLKADLSKLLQEGLIQGRNPRQLARHLTKRFGVAKSDAERLMRTELARVQTEAQKKSFEQNGYDQYEFIALGSACGICRELDGKHFEVKAMMPGENAPPMHPNCRCSVAAHVDEEEFEAWIDFLDKGGTTEEWERLRNTGKSVESNSDSGIIEMTRKGNNARKGLKFISDKKFNDLTIAVRKKGAIVMRGTEEVEKHLDFIGAAASTVGDTLLFRKDVCVSEVLEETYHFEQNLSEMNSDKGEPLRSILNEIDAKRYLLDNEEKFKIPRNEIELTKKQLKSYQKELDEFYGEERYE